MKIEEDLVPFEYQKKIKEGQSGGVVLVYVNGKDDDEVIKKSRFIVKMVDTIREYADGVGATIKLPMKNEKEGEQQTAPRRPDGHAEEGRGDHGDDRR